MMKCNHATNTIYLLGKPIFHSSKVTIVIFFMFLSAPNIKIVDSNVCQLCTELLCWIAQSCQVLRSLHQIIARPPLTGIVHHDIFSSPSDLSVASLFLQCI